MPQDRSASEPHDPESAIERALEEENPARGERWLVAFSGGVDSTALAAALASEAPKRMVEFDLVHIDHRMDTESASRAHLAARLARDFDKRLHIGVASVPASRFRRESPEAAARRLRYLELERFRTELRATRILTAHQRDDQIETILLRILRGAPVESLGGIERRRGALLRPLLEVGRAEIERFLARRGLEPIRDPTNERLDLDRGRIRARLLPELARSEPGAAAALLRLAPRSAALRARLEAEFARRFERGTERVELARLLKLPEALRLPALRWLLHERFGASQLPSFPSLEAFLSGLEERNGRTAALSFPAGSGRKARLLARGGRLGVERPASRNRPFSYTFSIPGEAELPELGLRVRVRRSPVEPWMFRGDRRRAGLSAGGGTAVVRSRRPGDRLRPLGAPGTRKLKELLVDRRVPAAERDRLPILEIDGAIAWVAGITIDERCRLAEDEAECWLAELLPPGEAGTETEGERDVT